MERVSKRTSAAGESRDDGRRKETVEMGRKLKLLIVGLMVASLLTVGMVGMAQAQDEVPTPLEAAAEALGMTADELSTQLWGGRTLADLADRAGVDLQTVRDAVEAAQKANVRASIEQAVEDGRLSQEQADWLLQGLDQGYWGPGVRGFGMRGGFGFGHMKRGIRGWGGGWCW
jgi:hypothetical protein